MVSSWIQFLRRAKRRLCLAALLGCALLAACLGASPTPLVTPDSPGLQPNPSPLQHCLAQPVRQPLGRSGQPAPQPSPH